MKLAASLFGIVGVLASCGTDSGATGQTRASADGSTGPDTGVASFNADTTDDSANDSANDSADASGRARDAGTLDGAATSAVVFPELGFASKAAARIEGNWNNSKQAGSDKAYDYGNIRLQICRVPVPGLGAAVFYQQSSGSFARRRLLSLLPNATGFELKSYGLKADRLYTDWCTQKKRLPLTESDLQDLSTCVITYTYLPESDEFRGKAPEPRGCASTFNRAVRLEVDEWFAKDQIRIWERWYDAADAQVEGAPHGPYLYERTP